MVSASSLAPREAFAECGYGAAFPMTLVPQGSREREPLQKSWSSPSTLVPEFDTSVGAVSIIPLAHLTVASTTVLLVFHKLLKTTFNVKGSA